MDERDIPKRGWTGARELVDSRLSQKKREMRNTGLGSLGTSMML